MSDFTPKSGFVLSPEDAARSAYDDALHANAPEPDPEPADDPRFDDYLAKFTEGYITCAEWLIKGRVADAENDEEAEWWNTVLDDPDVTDEIDDDCRGFCEGAWNLLADLDAAQCGHDFYLTRNGHGAGFWDRGLGHVGSRLTAHCNPYSETEY